MSGRQMISIGRHTAAGDFGIDVGAALEGVFEFLENEYGRAFTHHETVARSAERTRCRFRAVVTGRKSVHGIEASHTGGIDGSFRTTGNNSVGFAETDKVEGVDNGIVR